ncbi:MAG: Cytosolic iron-sulfur protein assembly protein [Watsoniomyces obsoletus]|nr:MAG: Cytosolic iron-sulfur protein assembly protein [Watsoniomyces obsoletus]
MGRSLASESARPMLAGSTSSKGTDSQRASIYSDAPSLARSDATAQTNTSSNDPVIAEFKYYTDGLDRLENQRLQQQRYVPSREKTETISQLALQAKLERALGRRMTGQDAVLRPKVMLEKPRVDYSRTATTQA